MKCRRKCVFMYRVHVSMYMRGACCVSLINKMVPHTCTHAIPFTFALCCHIGILVT